MVEVSVDAVAAVEFFADLAVVRYGCVSMQKAHLLVFWFRSDAKVVQKLIFLLISVIVIELSWLEALSKVQIFPMHFVVGVL